MSLLQQVTRATAERQDPDSIFQVAVRSLENQLPVDFSGIFRLAEGGTWLETAHLGAKARERAPLLLDKGGAGPSLDAAGLEACLAGELLCESDIGKVEVPFLRHLAALGLHSAVVAPLRPKARSSACWWCPGTRRPPSARATASSCASWPKTSRSPPSRRSCTAPSKGLPRAARDPPVGPRARPPASPRRNGERHRPRHQQLDFARLAPPRNPARGARGRCRHRSRPHRDRAARGARRGPDGVAHAGALPPARRPGKQVRIEHQSAARAGDRADQRQMAQHAPGARGGGGGRKSAGGRPAGGARPGNRAARGARPTWFSTRPTPCPKAASSCGWPRRVASEEGRGLADAASGWCSR